MVPDHEIGYKLMSAYQIGKLVTRKKIVEEMSDNPITLNAFGLFFMSVPNATLNAKQAYTGRMEK